ncbi:MAG: SGNH/GDSL hydrolase family protein [Inhella sp.]|jgi:lysophospholipase L1-like esterase|nr:SGNH/GDSL hydrolase family protein [Inhella sp.]
MALQTRLQARTRAQTRALTAAKLALFPLLAAQGLRVRLKALELPEAEGPRMGEALPTRARRAQPLRLLVVGDSSAAGVGVAQQREALAEPLARLLAEELGRPVQWQLQARTGHSALEALAALRETALAPADILVSVLGVNDVVRQVPASRTREQLDALHEHVREQAGVRYWLHCGVPPMQRFPLLPAPLRWLLGAQAELLNRELHAHLGDQRDRALRRLPMRLMGRGPGLMAADGFHPGPRGYALWAESLAPFIARRWARVERD